MRKSWKWVTWGLLTITLVAWYTGPTGYYKLQHQCRIDGGLRITRPVKARGIVLAESKTANCEFCQSLVQERVVDFVIFESTGWAAPRRHYRGEAGFYRMSIGHTGDEACVDSRNSSLRSDECLAVSRLEGEPGPGYALTRSQNSPVPRLPGPRHAYLEIAYLLRDRESNEIVAQYHRYSYDTPFSRLVGGQGLRYWCPSASLSVEEFLRQSLQSGNK